MNRRATIRAGIKVLVFTGIVGMCLTLIVTSLLTPVAGPKNEFTAVIADVSGLHDGNDVRMSGVQVGKVEKIDLVDGTARVQFSVHSDRPIYDNTQIAVRYQNLVGQRYLELVQADQVGAVLPAGSTIGVDHTVASFDVSKLFNGFAPLFDTLDPTALNAFAENMLNVLQGDGTGFGAALKDIEKLADLATDRQEFILVIVRNLDNVAKEIRGKAQRVGDLVRQINPIAANIDERADQIHESAVTANKVVTRAADLLEELESVYDDANGPLRDAFFRVIPMSDEIKNALRLAPSLLTGINNRLHEVSTPVDYTCSKGRSGIPGIGAVVLASQRLVVCK